MPLIKINSRKIWNKAEKKEINDRVHQALVGAIQIPDWDYFHRFYEFEDEDFIFPNFKSNKFIIIEIHLFLGRSDEMKKKIYQNISTKLMEFGISSEDIFIQIIEQPNSNWGIAGKMKE